MDCHNCCIPSSSHPEEKAYDIFNGFLRIEINYLERTGKTAICYMVLNYIYLYLLMCTFTGTLFFGLSLNSTTRFPPSISYGLFDLMDKFRMLNCISTFVLTLHCNIGAGWC